MRARVCIRTAREVRMRDPHHLSKVRLGGPVDSVKNEKNGDEAHHKLVHERAFGLAKLENECDRLTV